MFDLKLAGKAGLPDLLGTRDVIRFATIEGARTAGLDVGSTHRRNTAAAHMSGTRPGDAQSTTVWSALPRSVESDRHR